MLHGFDLSYAQAGLSLAEIADKAGFLLLRAGYGGDYKDQDDSEFGRFAEEAVSYTHLDVYKRQHLSGRVQIQA